MTSRVGGPAAASHPTSEAEASGAAHNANTAAEPADDPESSHSRTRRAGGSGGGLTYSKSVVDKERKIGHRRVDDTGQVSYKKIQSNHLMGSIQLGIENSLGALGRYDERDLLMQDFMTVDTVSFPKNGSQLTPAHPYSDFTFRTMAPLAFRYFLHLFGIKREDFMVSLCTMPLVELGNPGASGSIFYLTNDDEFIMKTVQHKEAEFLQKLLPGYYMNLNQNPHTLLPKFFGMYCYQCNQKNIRLTVMNNLLPTNVKMHLKFDLKGSTYKRKANKREREKGSPTYKDLDFSEFLPDGLLLEPETYNALISTLRRDCRVLESFRIMDYSLLIGIHNLDQAARGEAVKNQQSGSKSRQSGAAPSNQKNLVQRSTSTTQKQKLVAHSTAMESIQAQTEPIDEQEHLPPGGIPARNHKGERLLLYLGIIDILQSYRMKKKLEHTIKSIIHDGDTVSVHRPGFYAHRFLDFMADTVFKKIPSPLKHSPSRRSKRDSVKKMSTAGLTPTGAGNNSSDEPADSSQKQMDRRESSGVAAGYSSSARVDGTSSLNRPRNRLHEQVKHSSTEVSSERLSESRMSEGCGNDHGTPSRLSVGTGSVGGGWNTPTWTEGTPSFTESSYSGDLAAGGSTPSRNLRASRESIVTRNYKDTPYHETEITRL